MGHGGQAGCEVRHVPLGSVRHSLRGDQEVLPRLLRELLQRGPDQDPEDQRGQGALPARGRGGRCHRE